MNPTFRKLKFNHLITFMFYRAKLKRKTAILAAETSELITHEGTNKHGLCNTATKMSLCKENMFIDSAFIL